MNVFSNDKALNTEYASLPPEEKRKQLYLKQKRLLETFLEKKAISQAQFDKSLSDLTEKMGMGELLH